MKEYDSIDCSSVLDGLQRLARSVLQHSRTDGNGNGEAAAIRGKHSTTAQRWDSCDNRGERRDRQHHAGWQRDSRYAANHGHERGRQVCRARRRWSRR